jgi:hypothetical protein
VPRLSLVALPLVADGALMLANRLWRRFAGQGAAEQDLVEGDPE